MIVHVTCYSDMRRYAPDGRDRFDIEVQRDSSIRRLLEKMHVPSDVLPVAIVNGNLANRETPLCSGDHIVLFTAAEGG